MERKTVHAKLVAEYKDIGGYITYVFQLLDEDEIIRFQTNYIMCVRYPNWDQQVIQYGTFGYLEILEVLAGIDQYFKDGKLIPYGYSNIQFLKFVEEPKKMNNRQFTLDD